MSIVTLAIVILQGLVLLALMLLLFQHIFSGYWSRYLASRKNYFEQPVLGLLEDPERITVLERGLRPFDRRVIGELLLQQATELKGQERHDMTGVFERLEYVSSEKKQLRSRAWWHRREAAIKLGIMQSESAVPDLVRAVRDNSEVVRLAAVRALGETNHPEGIKVLLDVMRNTESWTGDRVLEVVANIGDSVKEEVLLRLKTTTKPRARLLLVQLCGIMRWTEAVALLIPLLDDADVETRVSTAEALGNIGDEAAASYLISMLQDPHWEVRAQAAKSLGLLQDKEALMALTYSLSDESWWVRYNAANSLYQLGNEGLYALRSVRGRRDEVASGMAAQVLAERELGLQP